MLKNDFQLDSLDGNGAGGLKYGGALKPENIPSPELPVHGSQSCPQGKKKSEEDDVYICMHIYVYVYIYIYIYVSFINKCICVYLSSGLPGDIFHLGL